MKKNTLFSTLSVLVIALMLVFSACRKKADTIAQVTVRDNGNALVSNARVILFGQSTTDPIQPVVRRDTAFTNESGVATFNYNDVYQLGQAGVAVLNITAEKDDMFGQGIIKVEQEEVSTATVFIQP